MQNTKDLRLSKASSFQKDTAIVTVLNIYTMPHRILLHFSTMPLRAGSSFGVSSKSEMDLSNVIEKFLTRVTMLVESKSYSHTVISK